MKTDPKIEPAKAGAERVESAKARILDDDEVERMLAQKEADEAKEAMSR